MTPYLRRVEKGEEARSEVGIGFLDFVGDRIAEVLI
jgi:hypothetical protein